MGNDNKTVRSKINNLTVLCENLWAILYYFGGLFYGLKLQLISLLTVLLSLPINELPYPKHINFMTQTYHTFGSKSHK